jgi:PAS domain S-box-containing protein
MGGLLQRLWAAARGREADASLRADVARLQGVIDSTMDAVVSVDGRGKIVLFNPGAEQMFGYRASEALGRSVGLLLPERLRDSHGEHLTRFAAAGTSRRMASSRGEIFGRRADGTEFPAGASICRATVGDDVQLTAIVRDLTSIRAAERESARLAAVLENHSDHGLLAHATAR